MNLWDTQIAFLQREIAKLKASPRTSCASSVKDKDDSASLLLPTPTQV
jgi:hypothetical protein